MQHDKIKIISSLFFIGLLIVSTIGVSVGAGEMPTDELEQDEVAYVLLYPEEDLTTEAGQEELFDAEAYDDDDELITDDPEDFDWQNAPNGVFYEENTGNYDVIATYDGVSSDPTTVTVEPADPDYIVVEPEDSTVEAGQTEIYTATSYDEFHNEIEDVTGETDWTDDVDDSEWTDNELTPETAGEWTVMGTYTFDGEDLVDTVGLEVEPAAVNYVVIDPDEDRNVGVDEQLVFDSWAYDEYDNLITDDPEEFDWQNAPNGVFREQEAGDYDVTATYDGVTSPITTITVLDIDHVEIDPAEDQTVEAGEELEFTAEAYDNEDQLITDDVTEFEWENIHELDEDENLAIFYQEDPGGYDVDATYGGVTSNTTTVTVEPAEVGYVEIDPAEDLTITAGEEEDFTATAYDEYDNIVEDDDVEFTWQNTDGTGLFDETETGSYEVTATYDDVTSEPTTVTVEPAEVDYVEIDPAEDRIVTAGEELNFTAEAYDEYENLITDDVTEFNWENISEVDEENNTAIFYEEETDDYNVTATYEDETSPVTRVTVEPGDPDDIEIIDHPEILTAGESFQMIIEAYDEFGNLAVGGELEDFSVTSDHDEEIYFESLVVFGDGGQYIAEVDEDEVVTAAEHSITASSNPSDTVEITVTPGPVDRVEIDPEEDQTVEAGQERGFTAEAYDEYDNLITDDVTLFDWDNIEDVDDGAAIFYEEETGEYEVTATYDGVSNSTTVTVEPAEVEYVEIYPAEDRIVTAGEELNFTAEAYDEYENLITDDVAEFDWTNITEINGEENVALFNEEDVGEYEVTAEYEPVTSDPTTVTVEPGPVDEVVIDPAEDMTIPVGETIDFEATAYDGYGNIIEEDDEEFEWQNTDETGLFDETESGDHEVSATFEDVSSEPTIVTVQADPNFEVEIDEPKDGAEFEQGESITVEFTVTNTGDVEDTQEITLSVDEDEIGTEEINLEPGQSQEGEFTWYGTGDPGDYTLELESEDDTDTVEIEIQAVVDDPGVAVTDLCDLWWILIVLLIIIALLVIYYLRKPYTLKIDEIEGEGKIHVGFDEVTEFPYEEDYKKDELVELLAFPEDQWEFVRWTGVPSEKEEKLEISLEMDEDKDISAVFERAGETEEETSGDEETSEEEEGEADEESDEVDEETDDEEETVDEDDVEESDEEETVDEDDEELNDEEEYSTEDIFVESEEEQMEERTEK